MSQHSKPKNEKILDKILLLFLGFYIVIIVTHIVALRLLSYLNLISNYTLTSL